MYIYVKLKCLELLFYTDTAKKVTTTPLLEYLKLRKQEKQRIKDEKREERRKRDLERRRTKDDAVISKVKYSMMYQVPTNTV